MTAGKRAGLAAVGALALSAWALDDRHAIPSSRSLELVETVRMDVPRGKQVKLWIPRLPSDSFQTAELLGIDSPWPYRSDVDPDFGNPLLCFEPPSSPAGRVEIRLKYRLTRKEQSIPDPIEEPRPSLHLKPRGLLVLNDEVRDIAREATRGLEDPLEKARALYDYVLGHVDYDTSGEGWGRGDVVYACKVGKGNCTDFHSLFIALALAEGIPARFRIGYPLPEAAEGPIAKPYHCWAEFHVPEKGWVAVDISEAWKHPSRAGYFFGNLDPHRVLVSTGREIRLPRQDGPALNYLVRPYAETDGRPFYGVEVERRYKDIPAGKT